MNFHVLSWLLFFLAPGGCPIYSINVSTLEVPTDDFQNELTLHTMLSSELQQHRNNLDATTSSKKRSFPPKFLQELSKISRSPVTPATFLGTNLFDSQRKTCFSMEEMALMSARQTLEQLVPKSYPNCLLTDSVVHMLIRYVNTVNRIVQEMSDETTRRVPQKAFYDALGGYLRYYLVPAAQVSYYAGSLKLKTMQCLLKIKRQSYVVLNTNGNAWRSPSKDIMCQFKSFKIEPIELRGSKFEDGAASCSQLDQHSVSQDSDQGQMIVPLPQLEPVDSEGHLSNIFLPFRQRRIYNLRSPICARVLVKFFKTVTSCHRFQGMSQASYNNKLLNWIRENVDAHYIDEVFYPGLGGILRIQETLLYLIKKDNCKEDDKNNYAVDSRKVIRSTGEWQEDPEPIKEEKSQDVEPAEQENVTAVDKEPEECRECNNSSLVWYIAAILVLLLIIILIVIFCCMRRGRMRKDKVQPMDVEAPPSIKPQPPKSVKERPKGGDSRSTYYGNQENNRSSSSLNCQLKQKCLPTKFTSKKEQSYYRLVSAEISPQRQLVSLSSHQYDLTPSSDIEEKEAEQKQRREKKRKGRKEGVSGQSRTPKSLVDRKNSSPVERQKASRVRIDTEDSIYDSRRHRKKSDETRAGNSSRLKGGTVSSPHSTKDTPSWETTFDDV
ncbi:uncharacterized protein LOC110177286 [Drosophila serrata]|uniref:uncharacterized protein LOC110177286 n=1 Tax=Drosophila serrata TaxID=7274 RepID=UPI000A1D1ED5|nr:uncharacterized protein LOC110177286 [Drosophila serrata]